ncbi:hypothetical protein GCM10009616_33410 [Microlunatus lacustris]
MDLEAATEELYAGSPDDFVERRTALVAQARAARDRPLAKAVAALRRPTRTAWLLNRLARDDADGITALLGLAAELEDAQRRRSGPDLRRLSAERRRRVDQLARDAVRRGTEAGYAAAEGALQEVSQSLQSALGDPGTAELLHRGRLTTAVSYGGFGSTDLMTAMAASMPAAERAEGPAEEPAEVPEPEPAAPPELEPEPEPQLEPEDEPEPEEEGRLQRERLAEQAEVAWQQAAAALAQAEQEAEEATARADSLADRVEELQAELARAEADEAAARSEARTARRQHQAATRAAAEAEQARDEARAALDR